METLVAALTVFVLAIFIGFEIITKVPPTLHTPLMSGSNAISGIALIGAILFLITLVLIFGFIGRRIRGTDETSRNILLIALVTEGIMLLIGLMVWAMWPAGGLYSAEHGWHHETGSFVFFLVVISTVVTIFYAFLITERRVVRTVLRPEERDKIQ